MLFHLSLTVLVHYRSDRYTQAYPTVWADSHGIPRGPRYSGHDTTRPCAFGYGAITPLRPGIQPGSPHTRFSPTGGRRVGTGTAAPTTPIPQPPTGITRHRFSHHPLSLATTHGVSFPAGTEMFHFPAYPPHKTLRCRPTTAGGLPHSDTLGSKPLSAAPRGLSRPPHVLHRYCLPRHPPYAHGNKPTNPAKKGATGPCHLHWNTLRQLIRSSKHHPHQQCGRLTKTLANTIHAPTRQAGTQRFDKINSTNTPGTPHKGTPFMLASTLQFSNHHTTPPQTPTPQRTGPGRRERNTTPDKGAWRSGNPTACTTPLPTHTTRGAGALTFSSQQGTPPGHTARKGSIPSSAHHRAPTKTP